MLHAMIEKTKEWAVVARGGRENRNEVGGGGVNISPTLPHGTDGGVPGFACAYGTQWCGQRYHTLINPSSSARFPLAFAYFVPIHFFELDARRSPFLLCVFSLLVSTVPHISPLVMSSSSSSSPLPGSTALCVSLAFLNFISAATVTTLVLYAARNPTRRLHLFPLLHALSLLLQAFILAILRLVPASRAGAEIGWIALWFPPVVALTLLFEVFLRGFTNPRFKARAVGRKIMYVLPVVVVGTVGVWIPARLGRQEGVAIALLVGGAVVVGVVGLGVWKALGGGVGVEVDERVQGSRALGYAGSQGVVWVRTPRPVTLSIANQMVKMLLIPYFAVKEPSEGLAVYTTVMANATGLTLLLTHAFLLRSGVFVKARHACGAANRKGTKSGLPPKVPEKDNVLHIKMIIEDDDSMHESLPSEKPGSIEGLGEDIDGLMRQLLDQRGEKDIEAGIPRDRVVLPAPLKMPTRTAPPLKLKSPPFPVRMPSRPSRDKVPEVSLKRSSRVLSVQAYHQGDGRRSTVGDGSTVGECMAGECQMMVPIGFEGTRSLLPGRRSEGEESFREIVIGSRELG